MPFDKEQLDSYFDRGVDLQNRRVFVGDIDSTTVTNIVKGLYLMETDDPDQPCEMFISSNGGEVCEALALYDIMQTIKCPIHTFAYGKCMSAAPLLLAAGEKGHRWVAPNVFFMYHEASAEVDGKLRDAVVALKYEQLVDATWMKLMAEHSDKDVRFFKRLNSKPDYYFGADEAVEWGIADSIWVEKQ